MQSKSRRLSGCSNYFSAVKKVGAKNNQQSRAEQGREAVEPANSRPVGPARPVVEAAAVRRDRIHRTAVRDGVSVYHGAAGSVLLDLHTDSKLSSLLPIGGDLRKIVQTENLMRNK